MKPITYLNISQFFGALNDYVFRFLVQFYLIEKLVPHSFTNAEVAGITAILFIVPFLILVPIAGIFSDWIRKERSVVILKIVEVAVALLGVIGFYFNNIPIILISFIGLASHSAMFSPIKYGIISELVKKEDLTKTNGVIEGLTYIAIVVGPIIAGMLNHVFNPNYHYSATFCLIFAVIGYLAAIKIKNSNPFISKTKFSWFFFLKPFTTIYQIRKDSYLSAALMGSILFFFIAGFAQLNLLPYGIEVFKLSKETSANLFTFGAIGIATGSFLAGLLSKKLIEFGIVPIGVFLVSLSSIAIGLIPDSVLNLGIWIFLFGLGSGIFLVPLHTFIQYQSPVRIRSNLLAANTFFSLLSVAVSTLVSGLLIELGFSLADGFIILGCLTILIHLATLVVLPDFFIRLIGVMTLKIIYRIRTVNDDFVPREGGALLIPNHVSFVDALVLAVSLQRRIRFIMWDEFYNSNLFVKYLCRIMRVIPISLKSRQDSEVALIEARKALAEGWLVCIFAEGGLTRTGTIGHFKSGFESILKDSSYPIIPIYLSGLWGSYFSLNRNRSLIKSIKRLPFPVKIFFGPLLNSHSSAREVYMKVKKLEYAALLEKKPEIVIPKIAQDSKQSLTREEIVSKATSLAQHLKNYGKNFGILLPASVDSLIANLAVNINSGTVFNLNYTYTTEQLQELLKLSNISNVIATDKLQQKFNDLKNITWVNLEYPDTNKKKVVLSGKSLLATSGSSGTPKLVLHSINKILLNAISLSDVFLPKQSEIILSALPHFHSFGLTGSVWLPVASGCSVFYLENPLSAKTVVETIEKHQVTYLITTPSFLRLYIKSALPEQLKSLKLIVTGGEPLPEDLKKIILDLELKVIEGYGATELAPVVAVNIPNSKETGLTPLPGVIIRTKSLDSDSFVLGEQGILEVKSVASLDKYLGSEVNSHWYNTGDIAEIDKYNNLKINGRISRFSKIAGEMISHKAVEDLINEINNNLTCVVMSKTCENYGEKLILFYNKNLISKEKIIEIFSTSHIPNLWKVKPDNFYALDELPFLASGKIDFSKLKLLLKAD